MRSLARTYHTQGEPLRRGRIDLATTLRDPHRAVLCAESKAIGMVRNATVPQGSGE